MSLLSAGGRNLTHAQSEIALSSHPAMRRSVPLRVQEAGFEPANRYGLGPHPSAFDQAGRLLRRPSLFPRVYQHRDLSSSLFVMKNGDFVQRFPVNVGNLSIVCRIANGHHEHGFFVRWPAQNFSKEPHR